MVLKDLEDKYELELDRIVKEINSKKVKGVLLQFPDGMKPYALDIANFIESKTRARVRVFLGSCFGACDVPHTDCELVIQFGHSKWK